MAFLWPSPAGVRVPMTMGLAALLAARILSRNADASFWANVHVALLRKIKVYTWRTTTTGRTRYGSMNNRVVSNPRVGTRQTDKCAS